MLLSALNTYLTRGISLCASGGACVPSRQVGEEQVELVSQIFLSLKRGISRRAGQETEEQENEHHSL